eukprot:721208_1
MSRQTQLEQRSVQQDTEIQRLKDILNALQTKNHKLTGPILPPHRSQTDISTIDRGNLHSTECGNSTRTVQKHNPCIHKKYEMMLKRINDMHVYFDRKRFESYFRRKPRIPRSCINSVVVVRTVTCTTPIRFIANKRTQQVLIGIKNLDLNNDELRSALHDMN